MSPRVICVVLLALPLGALAAQRAGDARWSEECLERERDWGVKHCEVRVLGLGKGAGPITIDPGTNGGVAIEGWDRDTIEVHARIQTVGTTEDEAVALARDIRVVAAGRTIGVEGPDVTRHRTWGVSFVLYAPQRSDLKLDTYNGPIAVRDVSGRMILTAYNGPVSLDHVSGDVRARTTNGPLDIELGGDRWEGAGLDAETTNGPVNLAIPERYSARLEFGTVNGPLTIDFPLTITIEGRVGRRIATTLGEGGALVRIVTTNGPVDLRRN
ncbi:MAG TPA: DUF4097 family beta strand repeat-containing protein [Gemmatimonadales bacterium]|nr:DUF4097 family beta strand repeat-containing protein [Gemmatimonadales bacterium]